MTVASSPPRANRGQHGRRTRPRTADLLGRGRAFETRSSTRSNSSRLRWRRRRRESSRAARVWNAGRRRCATFSKPRPTSGAAAPGMRARDDARTDPRSAARACLPTATACRAPGADRSSSGSSTSATSLPPLEQPLEIRGQLHHRARERFDALLGLVVLAGAQPSAGRSAPSPRRAAPRRGSRRSSARRARDAAGRPPAAAHRGPNGRRRNSSSSRRAASSVLASSRLTRSNE